MHQLVKNAIGVAAVIGILVGANGFHSFSRSFSDIVGIVKPSSFRSFSVSGEGRVTAIPDVAQFTYTVRTEGGRDVAKIQQQNAEQANRAIAFVKTQGVESKDLHTISYHVEPKYTYFPCEKKYGDDRPCRQPEVNGYTVWQTVRVTARDFSKVGDLIAGVVREGANEVSQLSFTVDDPTALQQQARIQAIAQAKEKAQSIAAAGGFRLGQLLAIDEGVAGSVYEEKNYGVQAIQGNTLAPVGPTIEAGSQEIVIVVTLRYELE